MTTIGEEAINLPEIEQKESLKLIKNSRGYNYEIKILEINPYRL